MAVYIYVRLNIHQANAKYISLDREGVAANGGNPVFIRVGELPGHDATVPVLGSCLCNTLGESGGGHVSVVRITCGGGLANDKLVEGDARVGDLEQGGLGPSGR
jgi:hypothetical protein